MKLRIKEKRWSKDFEKPIYTEWKRRKLYRFDPKSRRPTYSIDTPPPYVNAPVHIGQATTYVLMDMFARFKRMTGHNVLFPLGLDRNGLPIEVAAERRFRVNMSEVPREKFIKYCKTVLEEASLASTETFLRSGIGFNSWDVGKKTGDVYLTDSDEYRALTQSTFIDLWRRGLIYQTSRVNNYCPGCRTTIADSEIIYKDIPSVFSDIKFKVKETGEEIIIATTRPELLCTCAMVIFNPADERYKHLEGKTAITPVFNKEVPIKAHAAADMEKGTGLVMMCSFGDYTDIRFFREQGLEEVIAINVDGTMNKNAGFLKGMKTEDARRKIIDELKKRKLLVKQTKMVHRTPVCERSKDNIEFIDMPEYYLKQMDYKDKVRKMADKMKFYSPRSKQMLLDWIDTVSMDWPVSRRRVYATEVPLWYCKKCGETIVPPPGRYYKPWKEEPPVKKCRCGSTKFRGEDRVFDTWMDSSISPLYILMYGRDDNFFKKHAPCTLRPQGKEIVRTWLYYTLLRCYLTIGKPIFKDVWINYHIVAGDGTKMSKSLGNVIDPQDVLDKFGAEPFRLWAAVEGNLAETDFRCSDERIEGAGKTLTKLWNVARFISMFPQPGRKSKAELLDTDKWILAELDKIVDYTRRRYGSYDFHNPATRIKHFIWETFASHYLELVKSRAYNPDGKFSKEEQNAAQHTLHEVLNTILQLMAPIIPFITHKLYMELNKEDVHFTEFPKAEKKHKVKFSTRDIVSLNSAVWKAKKDKGLPLNSEIKELTIPEKLKPLRDDIMATHKVKKLKYGKIRVKL